jgi:signal peptidase I
MADERISTTRPVGSPAVGPEGKAAAQPAAKAKEKKPREPRDLYREVAETVVFVVVLVLMLKTFVAEAFVIPTGSMAETLYGYHKMVTCEKCEYVFPLNCSNEVDPQQGIPVQVRGCRCPNCLHEIRFPVDRKTLPNGQVEETVQSPSWSSGDRVLVAKFLFDNDHLWRPHRHEVFVFKYPKEPQKGTTAWNYIKRCEGEPEETIAIFNGDLYVTRSLKHPLPDGNPKNFWMPEYCHMNDGEAVEFFKASLARREQGIPTAGDFEIVRKPAGVMLDMRRIVNDNDFQDTAKAVKLRRWTFGESSRWSDDNPKLPKLFTFAGAAGDAGEDWLAYGHRLREDSRKLALDKPDEFQNDPRQLIADQMGYNSGDGGGIGGHWVGDLMIDCHVKVTNAQGELVLELAKGSDRFQARFDLAGGDCALVWVDHQLPFGDGLGYSPSENHNPVAANDLVPARIGGVKGGLQVSHLQLWRDSYYTAWEPQMGIPQLRIEQKDVRPAIDLLTIYVQPGHYLALGDNSSQSSDSRYWGLVPERLLLGRALAVYFPFWPFSNPTRFGPIY